MRIPYRMAIASPGQASERSVTHDARILIVDDESDIANLLGTVLREEGFSVRVVTDSRQALEAFNGFRPDLVSLDVMMPSVDGISLCLQLRKETDIPILFVSAKSDPPDRVVGLRIGADDYMGKPFDNNELVARVEALLRRRSYTAVSDRDRRQLRFGVFVIDLGSVQAIHGDTALPLTPTEFKLLKALAGEPGRVFTRDDLLTGVWGYPPGNDTRMVDVHVGRLRKKLLDGGVSEVSVETARGFGYKLARTNEGAEAP
jgi:two-component system response regulator MtrA